MRSILDHWNETRVLDRAARAIELVLKDVLCIQTTHETRMTAGYIQGVNRHHEETWGRGWQEPRPDLWSRIHPETLKLDLE